MADPEENKKKIDALGLEGYPNPCELLYRALEHVQRHHEELCASVGRDHDRSYTLSLVNRALKVFDETDW